MKKKINFIFSDKIHDLQHCVKSRFLVLFQGFILRSLPASFCTGEVLRKSAKRRKSDGVQDQKRKFKLRRLPPSKKASQVCGSTAPTFLSCDYNDTMIQFRIRTAVKQHTTQCFKIVKKSRNFYSELFLFEDFCEYFSRFIWRLFRKFRICEFFVTFRYFQFCEFLATFKIGFHFATFYVLFIS